MTAPGPDEPCLDTTDRAVISGGRVRVLELLATGTNGGAQEHVHALVSRIDRERYDVEVVSLSAGSSIRRLQRAGFPVTVIEEADDQAAVEALIDIVARSGIEVIHNHMYRAEVVGTRAAVRLGQAGRLRPFVVSTVHSSRLRSDADRGDLAALTASMDRLIAVSGSIAEKIQAEGRDVIPVSIIHNGVDLERYAHQDACCTLRDEYALPADAQIVGVVARLEAEKGHRTLLDAWPLVLRSVPSARLLVIGEGSRREALEAQAALLGIADRVVFTGRREDVPAVTAALDVAVLPSYREAQGLAILEAMALSRPVVASAVGGIPEMVEDERTGLLVPPHDADRLAAAIVRLLTDHPLADILGRAGHDLVHERFCIERMVDAIEAIYDEGARAVRFSEAEAV